MDMDEGAKRWMFKYTWANYWRVSSWYDLDDLVQEGYECWWYVAYHYPNVKDRPHLMRLFKLTLASRIHDLSKKKTKQPDLPFANCIRAEETETTFIERHDVGVDDLCGLAHAPKAISDAILSLIRKAEKLRNPSRRYSNGKRQTTNEKLCALVGCDPSMIDLVAEIKHYLGE